MKKKVVWAIILFVLIGVGVFFLFKNIKREEVVKKSEQVEEVEEKEEKESQEYEYTGATDFSKFSTEKQILGKETEELFEIEEMEDLSRDGFHQFTFTLNTKGEDEPFVSAMYIANLGVIRLDFQKIERDSSGIGYQQERKVGKDGVLRIYHDISPLEDQELYDIGVTKSTVFFLTSELVGEGKWYVMLQVKYPGVADLDIDLGSESFSKEKQSIEGVGAEESAAVTAYTFGRSSGLLKLVWTVTSNSENPIPLVSAQYNEKDELVVTFESLSMDRVASSTDILNLPSSIVAQVERVDSKSIYTFTGMSEAREYKLSASISPNQVLLEIK